MNAPNAVIGVTQAARILHVSKDKVHRLHAEQLLPEGWVDDAGRRKWFCAEIVAYQRRRGELAAERGAA